MSRFCPRCGQEAPQPHPGCREALSLEPPRFCDECGRRLRVQVYPDRVDARCPEHGPRASGAS